MDGTMDSNSWLSEFIRPDKWLSSDQSSVETETPHHHSPNQTPEQEPCTTQHTARGDNCGTDSGSFGVTAPQMLSESRATSFQLPHRTHSIEGLEPTIEIIMEQQASTMSRHSKRRSEPKQRSAFSKQQVAILRDWLTAHIEYPYPNSEDLSQLSQLTSLHQDQVYRWFTNRRARRRQSQHINTSDSSQRTPLEAYLAEPLEHGVPGESSIHEASRSPDYLHLAVPMERNVSQSSSQMSMTGCSSYLGFDQTNSRSSPDPGQPTEGPRRQGRKRTIWRGPTSVDDKIYKRSRVLPTSAPSEMNQTRGGMENERGGVVFYCTFSGCHVQLTNRTWKRHEESKHIPRQRWVCLRNGFRTVSRSMTSNSCVLCGLINPDDNHALNCSRISDCMSRKESDRVFARKDHLKQHLKNFHGSSWHESMDSWKVESQPSNSTWLCGFCGKTLFGWDARANHISKHFRDGANISEWDLNRASQSIESTTPMPDLGTNTAYEYPYPAPTQLSTSQSPKSRRPSLFLDIPDMSNGQTPSPVDRLAPITPPDAINAIIPVSNARNHTTPRTAMRETLLYTNSMDSSPSGHNGPSWASQSPTPYITFSSDDPTGKGNPLPHDILSHSPAPPHNQGSFARLEERVCALEAELQQYRSGRDHQSSQITEDHFTPSPSRLNNVIPTFENNQPDDRERPYKCLEAGCPSQSGFRYPHQLIRHERHSHHERRFQHIMRRPDGAP